MKNVMNNAVALFVVVVVLLLLIPLNPFLLDMMFILNITASLMILLITMYIKDALEFSIYPSMLLITTLFRLSLNISSTRLILTEQGKAGQVIETFGNFVLQGNIIVGVIIFLIIVLVQFIVITKGAERIAEVSARFTLDAMPGKQMAIDADLSAGSITEEDARIRRSKIQKQADFYGAMDGATKIVKGDAIMSIIITLINFLAGTIIGLMQGGMEFSQVLQVYSIATIGDGLVSQIPSLLISTATGMIVTRSASDESLNEDVTRQFTNQPIAFIITGIILMGIILVPGAPIIQLSLLGGGLIFFGYTRIKKDKFNKLNTDSTNDTDDIPSVEDESDYFKDINNIYSVLAIEPIEMEFGYSLIPLVDENSGGNLINRIVIFRRQFASDMGFVVPSIRLRDSSNLNPNEYIIKIKGEEVTKGEILVDYYLALEPPEPTGQVDGIETIEPAYGIPSKWILSENKDIAELYGYTVIDPLSVMVTHLSETIKKYCYELLTRVEMMQLIETVKQTNSDLVSEVLPNIISYGGLQKILSNLLKESIPIKDLITIFETIVDSETTTKEIDIITENIRESLKRTITRKFCENGQIKVITLDAQLEKSVLASLTKGEHGSYLSLSPDIIQSMISQLIDASKKFDKISDKMIVLTSRVIRPYIYRLIEQFYPDVYVLSFSEIASHIQIQAIANIVL